MRRKAEIGTLRMALDADHDVVRRAEPYIADLDRRLGWHVDPSYERSTTHVVRTVWGER